MADQGGETRTPVQVGSLSVEGVMVQMQRDLINVMRDVATLSKIIVDGNGQAPLMVRVALLERAVSDVGTAVGEVRKVLDGRSAEHDRGRWNVLGFVVAGLFSLASAVISAMILLRK